MAWNIGFTNIASNLFMDIETIVVLLLCLGCLVFFAKNFILGTVLLFFTNACLFIWFYSQSYNYFPPLIIMFMSLVVMAFSLYAINKVEATGGGIV